MVCSSSVTSFRKMYKMYYNLKVNYLVAARAPQLFHALQYPFLHTIQSQTSRFNPSALHSGQHLSVDSHPIITQITPETRQQTASLAQLLVQEATSVSPSPCRTDRQTDTHRLMHEASSSPTHCFLRHPPPWRR